MFCLPFLGPLHNGAGLNEDPMHFWIDKRSDECGYNGRQRVPASLSSGRRRRLSKPMMTPVHRFAPIESRSSAAVRNTPTNQTPRPNQPYIASASISYGASRGAGDPLPLEASIYLDNTMAEEDMSGVPRPKPRYLRYYVLALLCIVIVMVTAIKYYYSMHSQGIVDISIESSLSLLAAGLMVSCILSGCRGKGSNPNFLASHSTPQHPAMVETEIEVPSSLNRRDEVILELHASAATNTAASQATHATTNVEPEQPPPPYHLAILLPPKECDVIEEVPPPTYDKAVVR